MMTSICRQTEITLDVLLQGYVAPHYLSKLEILGLTSNSKEVKKGYLFVALAGITRHAIDFVGDVVNSGAVAIIYDAGDTYSLQRIALLRKQYSVEFIAVENLKEKTGLIASRFYAYPSRQFKLIGVTGTDGKTSVTHLLVQAFNQLGKLAGSVGTLGYGVSNNHLKMTHFTTPEAITLQSILFELSQAHCEYVVMEVSSHALQQHRESGIEFDIAVLTNLGSDHLDYHGDLENYKAAKSRLFEKQNLSGMVLNLDDELGRSLNDNFKGVKVAGYSVNSVLSDEVHRPENSISLVTVEMAAEGLRLLTSTPDGLLDIQTGLIGDFNINNVLCCISVLYQLGFSISDIENSMQGLRPIPGRMEYFPSINQHAAVVIDFAHTEQALSACLNSLKSYVEGNIICVFGCGGDRDQSKRPKMAAVAESLADQVIVTDDNPRNESAEKIMQDILAGFEQPQKVQVIHDRELAIETAMANASEEDLVVIAGKGHEKIQIIGNQRLPFSDHYVVRQIRNRGTV